MTANSSDPFNIASGIIRNLSLRFASIAIKRPANQYYFYILHFAEANNQSDHPECYIREMQRFVHTITSIGGQRILVKTQKGFNDGILLIYFYEAERINGKHTRIFEFSCRETKDARKHLSRITELRRSINGYSIPHMMA